MPDSDPLKGEFTITDDAGDGIELAGDEHSGYSFTAGEHLTKVHVHLSGEIGARRFARTHIIAVHPGLAYALRPAGEAVQLICPHSVDVARDLCRACERCDATTHDPRIAAEVVCVGHRGHPGQHHGYFELNQKRERVEWP